MITLEHVTKIYDGETSPVLKDLSMTVEEGDFCVITGRSGIGKTTLLRLLLKEVSPTEGKIFVEDRDISRIPSFGIPGYRRKFGVIFQDFKLLKDKTVFENLEIARRIYGWSKKDTEAKITHILVFLGIDRLHARYPYEISGGEQQKVCLARALLNSPRILLADEPTRNLDPEASAEFVRLMELIHRQGTTIVMTTHDIATIKQEDVHYTEVELPETEDKDYA
ncbi:MAG: ATP-binding cassette domain-containing protein [Lachnospiraceae bacterium]|nr:ATP-binding cassette domain-containing protein [Lachnospiraceae bacterium]